MKEFFKKILPFITIGRILYKVPWSEKIFMTFDDGPNPDFTRGVLSVLKEYSVIATFFVEGKKAMAYPELVDSIISQGHTVANHTYSHLDLSTCGLKKMIQEMKQCLDTIPVSKVLRPPYGGISLASMLLALSLNYKIVFWSIDSFDYQEISPEQIVDNVHKQNPSPGDIILFHDKNEQTLKALPDIIEKLLANKLSFGSF